MNPWRVLLLDTKRSNPNHYICLAIERALRQHAQVASVIKADYLSAIEAARAGQCNLLLAFDGEELDRSIVARLAAICGTSVAWVTEDPYEQRTNVGNLDLFDLVFTNDSGSVSAYGHKGRHLPFAADPGIHYREIPDTTGDSHYLYDLFFAGTASEVLAGEISAALAAGDANAREVIATAAPLSAPTNKTHAPTSTMTVRSVCLKRSEVGARFGFI